MNLLFLSILGHFIYLLGTGVELSNLWRINLGDLKLNEIDVVLLGGETEQGFAVTDEVGVRVEVVKARQSRFTIEKILNAAHIGVTGFNDLDDLLQYLGRDVEYFDLAIGNSSAKVELFFLIRVWDIDAATIRGTVVELVRNNFLFDAVEQLVTQYLHAIHVAIGLNVFLHQSAAVDAQLQ